MRMQRGTWLRSRQLAGVIGVAALATAISLSQRSTPVGDASRPASDAASRCVALRPTPAQSAIDSNDLASDGSDLEQVIERGHFCKSRAPTNNNNKKNNNNNNNNNNRNTQANSGDGFDPNKLQGDGAFTGNSSSSSTPPPATQPSSVTPTTEPAEVHYPYVVVMRDQRKIECDVKDDGDMYDLVKRAGTISVQKTDVDHIENGQGDTVTLP